MNNYHTLARVTGACKDLYNIYSTMDYPVLLSFFVNKLLLLFLDLIQLMGQLDHIILFIPYNHKLFKSVTRRIEQRYKKKKNSPLYVQSSLLGHLLSRSA